MWKVQKLADGEFVVLALSGRLEGQQLDELQRALAAETGSQHVILDLENVKLADQETIKFLAGCEAKGAKLRNCSGYIRESIARERNENQYNGR